MGIKFTRKCWSKIIHLFPGSRGSRCNASESTYQRQGCQKGKNYIERRFQYTDWQFHIISFPPLSSSGNKGLQESMSDRKHIPGHGRTGTKYHRKTGFQRARSTHTPISDQSWVGALTFPASYRRQGETISYQTIFKYPTSPSRPSLGATAGKCQTGFLKNPFAPLLTSAVISRLSSSRKILTLKDRADALLQ